MVKPVAEVRKPEIVLGAIAALNKHGLSMISYDLIAEEARMSRQLVRHYFPDNNELMKAVCDALAVSVKETLAQGVVVANATERLSTFLDIFFDFMEDRKVWRKRNEAAYSAMMSIATSNEMVRNEMFQQQELLQKSLSYEVQVSYPKLSANACAEIGYIFTALIHGHLRLTSTLRFPAKNGFVTRAAMDRILESYLDHYEDLGG